MSKIFDYRAILSKNMVIEAKITYHDLRGSHVGDGSVRVPLDSQCVTGYVLADNGDQAKERAIAEVKQRYPGELGYGNHENVAVEERKEMY